MAKYKLGEICEIVSGSTPKTGIAEYWDGNLKWITPAEIDDESYIITDSARKLTELGVKKQVFHLSPLELLSFHRERQLEKLLLRVVRCIVTKDSKILSVRTG